MFGTAHSLSAMNEFSITRIILQIFKCDPYVCT